MEPRSYFDYARLSAQRPNIAAAAARLTMQTQVSPATPASGVSAPPHGGENRRSHWFRDPRRMRLISLEVLGTAAFMLVYFAVRGMRPEAIESSVQRSLHIIEFEQRLGIFHEITWQQAFLSNAMLMSMANFVYAWLHFPVMLVIALWLVVRDVDRFRFVRNVLVVSALIGIFSYWVLPAAPPRLMELHGYDFGFVDTVHGTASNVNYFQPGPFVNDYAAIPSFHFAWIALSSAAIWTTCTNRWVRVGAIAMSVVMWWAVTVTGNHYFFDMIMGGVVVALSWLVVSALQQRTPAGWLRHILGHPPDRLESRTA
jgi:hypothetical protein